jgi:hypothetical protein
VAAVLAPRWRIIVDPGLQPRVEPLLSSHQLRPERRLGARSMTTTVSLRYAPQNPQPGGHPASPKCSSGSYAPVAPHRIDDSRGVRRPCAVVLLGILPEGQAALIIHDHSVAGRQDTLEGAVLRAGGGEASCGPASIRSASSSRGRPRDRERFDATRRWLFSGRRLVGCALRENGLARLLRARCPPPSPLLTPGPPPGRADHELSGRAGDLNDPFRAAEAHGEGHSGELAVVSTLASERPLRSTRGTGCPSRSCRPCRRRGRGRSPWRSWSVR